MNKKILLLALGFCLSLFVKAQLFEDYCQGKIATADDGVIDGRIGSGDVSIAICLTGDMLKTYKNCQLSVVNVGIPASASSLPATLTGWVRAAKDGENLASGSVNCTTGWNSINMQTGYTVTGDESELWVGATWTQSNKLKIISFVGATNDNACWVAKGSTWTNYSSQQYGSLSIRAGFTGDALPKHNLILSELSSKQKHCKVGRNFVLTGTVKNRGTLPADSPKLKVTIDDEDAQTVDLQALACDATQDFEVSVPTNANDATGEHKVKVEALWSATVSDDVPANNVDSTTVIYDETFFRNTVIEEFTGTWCQYCPLGIVGLRTIMTNHPGEIIGIAVHNDDEFMVSAYDNYMYEQGFSGTSFPSSNFNRTAIVYPEASELERYYQTCDLEAEAEIQISAYRDGQTLHVTGDVTFDIDDATKRYRMAYVVLEDGLTASQKNAFSGKTGADDACEEFNSLSNPCIIEHNHVARGILPSPAGELRDFGNGQIVKGESYALDESLNLYGVKMADEKNVEIVALLINNSTNFIVNAAKCKLSQQTGIKVIENQRNTSKIYDLQGREIEKVSGRGIYIQNNRKFMK